jgi:CxxC motif-containing protein (DUF1111 family)
LGGAACLVLACGTTGTALTGPEAPGGALTSQAPAEEHAFGQRAPGASDVDAVYFNSGEGFFVQPWLEAPSATPSRQGLGPLYDAAACAECHVGNGRGRTAFDPEDSGVGVVLRLSVPGLGSSGVPAPEPTYGDQLQSRALDGVTAEGKFSVSWRQLAGSYDDGTPYTLLQPSYDVTALGYGPLDANCLESLRTAPATIGLGLLEAIPEARLRDLADHDDADGDGISGRINLVWDAAASALAVGRFGWKAEQPSLRQQAAASLGADLGVTSALFPLESCTPAEAACSAVASAEAAARSTEAPEAAGVDAGAERADAAAEHADAAAERADAGGSTPVGDAGGPPPELDPRVLDRLETYLRLLAVPARRDLDSPIVQRGERSFTNAGCPACHVPSHVTAANAPLAELRRQRIWPYTDLLLHDLGPDLSDGRPSFGAAGSEWRTPPLWGLGLYASVNGHEQLLHDGRARGVAEAVLWHGGEGAAARDRFRALSVDERAALVAFVDTL